MKNANFIVWVDDRTYYLCRTTKELVEAKKMASSIGDYSVFVLTAEFKKGK